MSEERSRRLSQLFDPLARFTDHSGAGQSASTPNSPRLMPRRSRDPPPPPPPRPVGQSRVDPLDFELDTDLGSVNWQERCLELQLELHRSRHQATRVHHMLSEKINIMVKSTILLILVMAAIIMSASPVVKKSRKEIVRAFSNCLEVGSHCMTSRYRCCPHYGGGFLGPMPMTCFKFGDGVCEFYHRIPNAKEYKRLVKQLNATNFNQLSKQYWDSVYAG